MPRPAPTLRRPPPSPYEARDPTETGAWPPGARRGGVQTVVAGRDNETAAGDHIGTAPDLDLGPSGGAVLAPESPIVPEPHGTPATRGRSRLARRPS